MTLDPIWLFLGPENIPKTFVIGIVIGISRLLPCLGYTKNIPKTNVFGYLKISRLQMFLGCNWDVIGMFLGCFWE